MSAFEYLSVMISIVLGLGITQLLSGFARWLEHRDHFTAYGPSIAWAAFLLLVHVQTWWSMFGASAWQDWNFVQFGAWLLQPIVLYLLATLVFPGAGTASHGLREYFFRQRRWFFGLLAALVGVSALKDVTRGTFPQDLNLAFHVVFAGGSLAGLTWSAERLHRWLAYATLLLFAAYIAVLFARL